jgi:hypothetical protein
LTWNENELQVPLQVSPDTKQPNCKRKKRTGGFSPGL